MLLFVLYILKCPDFCFRSGAQSDGQTDPYEQTDEEVARNAREIEQQSAVIQKEMEVERKMKTSSPNGRVDERASGPPRVKVSLCFSTAHFLRVLFLQH